MWTGRTVRRTFQGDAVFLSASVPSPNRDEAYLRKGSELSVTTSAIEIEEAVVSLARAVFSAGGRLVFGGHPSIAPLVAMVAAEYARPREAERGKAAESVTDTAALVTVYQLDTYRDRSPEATRIMAMLGHAKVIEAATLASERDNDPTLGSLAFPKSLSQMRERLIRESNPRAIVCIGGMEGIGQEVDAFAEIMPDRPIFALATTGGGAALLARRNDTRVRFIDLEVLSRLDEEPRIDFAESDGGRALDARDELDVPYPLVMQILVAELIGDRHTSEGDMRPEDK